jgi:hypothetical protein
MAGGWCSPKKGAGHGGGSKSGEPDGASVVGGGQTAIGSREGDGVGSAR